MAEYSPADRRAVAAAIDECWDRARTAWSHSLLLGRPTDDPTIDGLARLDLRTRGIEINGAVVIEHDLLDAMEGIVAHEVGHHVRYPGTFATHTRMLLLERSLMPIAGYSAANLFTDLMINHRLAADPTIRASLAQIYRALCREHSWKKDPAFSFYLAIYEELWALPPLDLIGEHNGAAFEEAYPGYRAEAQLLGQRLFNLGPNLFTQFLYFLSVLTRYLAPHDEDEHPTVQDPCRCGKGEPAPDDWADALEPNQAERRALSRALAEGWISDVQYDRLGGEDAFERRIGGLPGQGTTNAERVPEIMAAYYRLTAEGFLFRPPPQRTLGERVVPTTLEVWEPGSPTGDIDWAATLVQHGPVLGRAEPLVRERIADYEGLEAVRWQPRTEIYLDVSGSMPDPRCTRNAMTLAAQILTMATVRAGGWVRALLYSHEYVRYWDWCRSEIEISQFLMHYVGGGTRFPFEVLESSVGECSAGQPIRVVISDSDFDRNYDADSRHGAILSAAASASSKLVLMLHRPLAGVLERYQRAGASTIVIDDFDDFPSMAAELSLSLFEGAHDGVVSQTA